MSLRIFFALEISDEFRSFFNEFIESQRAHFHSDLIRWSTVQNLHVTLGFIPAFNLQDLEKLILNIQDSLIGTKPFNLTLHEMEFFPNQRNPHVLSLKAGPADQLKSLAQSIGEGIVKTGYDIEKRPFRGHLTLGRFKSLPNHPVLVPMTHPMMPKIPIHRVVLYQSKPSKEGSLYIPLKYFSLLIEKK